MAKQTSAFTKPLPGQIRHQPGAVPKPDAVMEARVEALNALGTMHQHLATRTADLERTRGAPICVEGCGLCCMINTPLAAGLEGQYAVQTLAATPDVVQRAREWLTKPEPELTVYPEATPVMLGGTPNLGLTTERRARLADEIGMVASGACPFLTAELRCSIHQARPLACRTYGASFAPDAFCKRPRTVAEEQQHGYELDMQLGLQTRKAVEYVLQESAKTDPRAGSSGFFPTILLALADPIGFGELVASGKVPLAKTVLGPPNMRYPGTITQDDSNAVAAERAEHSGRFGRPLRVPLNPTPA